MSSPATEQPHTSLEVMTSNSNPLEPEIEIVTENSPLSSEFQKLELTPEILTAAGDGKTQGVPAVTKSATAETADSRTTTRSPPKQPASDADSKAPPPASAAERAGPAEEEPDESSATKRPCCPCLHRCCGCISGAIDACIPKKLQPFWNHPAGPKTVFFWAPLIKWLLVIAGIADLARPAETISIAQSVALALTGTIWSRYSLVIIPKNWALFSVNFFVAITQTIQCIRAIHSRVQQGKE